YSWAERIREPHRPGSGQRGTKRALVNTTERAVYALLLYRCAQVPPIVGLRPHNGRACAHPAVVPGPRHGTVLAPVLGVRTRAVVLLLGAHPSHSRAGSDRGFDPAWDCWMVIYQPIQRARAGYASECGPRSPTGLSGLDMRGPHALPGLRVVRRVQ